jgi:hypothetical protein
MGILKMKEETLSKRSSVILAVLEYFSAKEDRFTKSTIEQIAAAADNAFLDDILFEEFENWVLEKDDSTFLFLINHYWETKDNPKLNDLDRNLTGKVDRILEIKNAAKQEQAQRFCAFLNQLAAEKGLRNLDEIGKFLGVSAERARVMLEGIHKPQRKTIANVAKKFGIDVNEVFKRIL